MRSLSPPSAPVAPWGVRGMVPWLCPGRGLGWDHRPACRRRWYAPDHAGGTLRADAATVGRRLDVPVAPVATQDAERHFSYLSAIAGLDNPASSQITRDTLGWTPTRPGLISDLEQDRDLAAKDGETSGN
jgi:hypothetical protein